MTEYEKLCFEEMKYWLKEQGRASLDHDAAEERRCKHHKEKWADRLDAAKSK